MKEKFVMTTFFAGGMADVATTMVGLRLGIQEGGIAGGPLVEQGYETNAYVFRVAVTAAWIGLYSLSKQHPGRWDFSIDRAVRIANVISWSVAVMNAIEVAGVLR